MGVTYMGGMLRSQKVQETSKITRQNTMLYVVMLTSLLGAHGHLAHQQLPLISLYLTALKKNPFNFFLANDVSGKKSAASSKDILNAGKDS